MIYTSTYSTFNANAVFPTSGLVSTIGVQILNDSGATVMARTTSGITERPTGSGIYFASINLATLPAAPNAGHYHLVWDNGSLTPGNCTTEDLVLFGVTTFATALRTLQAAANTTNAGEIHVGVLVG